ncbi:hypothetical protein ACFWOX_36875 [Streptomyces sp. NPDC058467]|uniref:hypothetical protein n=1 Tax=Streptomyces sp. NPDC058467 TaxID=3346513 RepID=UPI0036525B9E
MEQRIGSSSHPVDVPVVPVVPAAAVDPAYIPGLTSPAPAEPEDAVGEAEEAIPDEAAPDEAAFDGAASEQEASDEDTEAESGAEADSEGPVFEASDRRASITADHRGVRLRLDDQECEFRWDEIGAVETEAPRFGKRFTITVHTPDRRWYPVEIEAKAKSQHKEWDTALDEVLDAYFEEGGDEDTAEEGTPEAKGASEVKSASEDEGVSEDESAPEAKSVSDDESAPEAKGASEDEGASEAKGASEEKSAPEEESAS